MNTSKRPWTRGEKLLLIAPLLIAVGVGALWFGSQAAKRSAGSPEVPKISKESDLESVGESARQFGIDVVKRVVGAPQVLETTKENSLRFLRLSDDGRLLAATGADHDRTNIDGKVGAIYLWDAKTLAPLPTILSTAPVSSNGIRPKSTVYALAFSPDGHAVGFSHVYFSSGAKREFSVFDIKTRRSLWSANLDAEQADFSPDGKLVAVNSNGTISVLDARSGKLIVTWKPASKNYERLLRWSPDGKFLACIGDITGRDDRGHAGKGGKVVLYTPDGKRLRELGSDFTKSFNFSPDGRQMISTGDVYEGETFTSGGTAAVFFVRCHDVATGALIWSRTSKQEGLKREAYHDAAFSPNGQQVAVHTAFSRQILLLKARDGKISKRLPIRLAEDTEMWMPHSLAFAVDSKRLFVRGKNSVIVFNFDS